MLSDIHSPADVRKLSYAQLDSLATEIRQFIVESVSKTGGHLGSNLGVVELTLALHRVFDSPHDPILFDTGHQAYVHKMITGRSSDFDGLRQSGGLSGYPSRAESNHDWIENSHASTVLSYAHGLESSLSSKSPSRRVVAVMGDGSMTGGMAYEALNNLGHSKTRVLVVLNDNGRSYAPTISPLTSAVSQLRLNPSLQQMRDKVADALRDIPAVGPIASSGWRSLRAAVREFTEPMAFFEALGVRYVGPVDGHNIEGLESALRQASEYDGPMVLHVLTKKGHGYQPAEDDDEKHLHDVSTFDPATGKPVNAAARSHVPHPAATAIPNEETYTDVFSRVLIDLAAKHKDIHAITAAMPGPTGLLPFAAKYPKRFTDVGIAEQHAVTMAAGMAMGGTRPVVAVYSTFLTRAIDQTIYDVGMHKLPVIFAIDRAGITGPDGPSHHGMFDMALLSKVPGMTIFAPSSAEELEIMLRDAVDLNGPVAIRYPRGNVRNASLDDLGSGLMANKVRTGNDVCILSIGNMLSNSIDAANILKAQGISASVWDVRCVKPLDPAMLDDAAQHRQVITIEDGIANGGIGASIALTLSEIEDSAPPVHVMGLPDRFIAHAKKASEVHTNLGIDAEGIAARAMVAVREPGN